MKKIYKKEDLDGFIEELLKSLKPSKNAIILLLEGDLGAGKTTFTQILAKKMGYQKEVVSPTFMIQKKYPAEYGFIRNLIHIDAYRLESPNEIEALGWSSWVTNPENLIVVEWPSKIGGVVPPYAHKLSFEHVDEDTRSIEINYEG